MPIRKEPCLKEMIQQRYREKILRLFDEWLIPLESVQDARQYIWKCTLDDISSKCYQLNEYFSELPSHQQINIISEILPKVFRELALSSINCAIFIGDPVILKDLSAIRQTILDTLLIPCIEEFDLAYCDKFALEVVTNCLHKFPNSTSLPMGLEYKISNLQNLKKIINPITCTKLTLKNVSIYCNGLKFLDVQSSKQLNDTCVDYIILLQNLEFLNIKECCISASSYRRILKTLPKLKNISWHSPVDDVITNLPKEYSERILNADITALNISILIEKLRNLIELSITVMREENLSSLVELTHLNTFKVKNCHFVDSYMNNFFEKSGLKLKVLEMGDIKNANLSAILRNCSNLKYLCLYSCDINLETVDKKEEMMSHFLNLRILKLNSNAYKGFFHPFIYFYRNLKVFHADRTEKINDKFVNVTLEFEGFRNLEEFVVSYCPLSITTAHALINSCPNIKFLGCLENWYSISDIDFVEIRNRIRRENMALKLLKNTEEWFS
ncbi:hypothetical protein L9F63_011980 [Diploptera punctata]|uniref:Uncharacterized protein n=1 Tax=Diploptera punctata TaxID=6984 RepID=A0AAD8ENS6_DIPPU|nr:hypothetical protein L9F63_011980 [Diploptera punctata]